MVLENLELISIHISVDQNTEIKNRLPSIVNLFLTKMQGQFKGDSIGFQGVLRQLDIHMQSEIKQNFDIYHASYTKINPKWIIDLKVKCKATNI